MGLFQEVNGILQPQKQSAGQQNSETGNFQTAKTGIDSYGISGYAGAVTQLKKIQTAPTNVTQNSVTKASTDLGKLRARNAKLAAVCNLNLQNAKELARTVDIQANYQQGMLSVNQQLERTTANYGIKVENFKMTSEVNEVGYQGYLKEFKTSSADTKNVISGW